MTTVRQHSTARHIPESHATQIEAHERAARRNADGWCVACRIHRTDGTGAHCPGCEEDNEIGGVAI